MRPPTGSRVQAVCRHTGATFRQPPPILPEGRFEALRKHDETIQNLHPSRPAAPSRQTRLVVAGPFVRHAVGVFQKNVGLGLTGAIFVLAVFAQLVYGDTPATDSAFNVLGLAVSIWFGAKGNSLYARHLLSRGYTELPETVEAANPQAALAQYFGRGGR